MIQNILREFNQMKNIARLPHCSIKKTGEANLSKVSNGLPKDFFDVGDKM